MGKKLKRLYINNFFCRVIGDYSLNSKKTVILYIVLLLIILSNAIISAFRPLYQGEIVDTITQIHENEKGDYFLCLFIFLTLLLLNNIFSNFQMFVVKLISEEIAIQMRQNVVEKLGKVEIGFFLKTDFSQMLPKIDKNIEVIKQYGIAKIIVMISNIVLLVVVVPYMLMLNWIVTVCLLLVFVLTPIFNKMFGKYIAQYSDGVLKDYKSLMSNVKSIFENWLVVRIFNCRDYTTEKFYVCSKQYKKSINKKDFYLLLYSAINIIVQIATSIIIWGIGGYFVLVGKMSVGSILAFMGYQSVIMRPILEMSSFYADYNIAKAFMKDFYGFLDEKEIESENKQLIEEIEKIEVLNVSFGYENTKKIFEEYTISFFMGKSYLIFGESGQGKTTLLNLITGILQPCSGSIYINGIEIKDINMYSFWKNIGYAFQNPHFFEDTILNNISPNEHISSDEIKGIAFSLDILDEIESMEDKWNTIVKTEPRNLSGGQIQRLDLLRNILKKSSLLIFDEPTSSLDEARRIRFYSILEKLKKERIIIIVSHDKEFEKRVDYIYKLE